MTKVYDRIYLVATIYLVQHGDKERLPGDPGLTELGKRQAAVTARWLRGMGLQAVYSSRRSSLPSRGCFIARAGGSASSDRRPSRGRY